MSLKSWIGKIITLPWIPEVFEMVKSCIFQFRFSNVRIKNFRGIYILCYMIVKGSAEIDV